MNRQPVNSEKIKSVGYDIDARILEVELSSDLVYQYTDVPDLVYQGLLYSPVKDNYYESMFENGPYKRIRIQ
ncbi:KTSC domain-containing protein [Petroclostridium sp. X23]|uniref:KTSC domain-containing protein n=1 Tax=Petroclostridium sp. X23 TaxID=3045146 RepID=UPI0024AE81AC|nr:KTSC domain-containing protein [Petroclostridium sp. X23]WHH60865.1 KTSC domain-containing protein [Petroclostridium sp. X23]